MMQPAAQAEFTLARDNIDFYDVEVINGVNIPISMGPTNTPAGGSSDPYFCGNPGSKHPLSGMGACTWDLKPPASEYNWVKAGGNACNSDADCSTGMCGLSFNPGHADLLWKTCGDRLGYWSADQVCGISPTFGAPFYCSELTGLYGCTGGFGSCY